MEDARGPTLAHRLAAIGSLVLVGAAIVVTLVRALHTPVAAFVDLVLLVFAVSGAWVALTRVGATRIVGAVAAVTAATAVVLRLVGAEGRVVVSIVVRLALLGLGVALARFAIGTTTRALQAAPVEGTPVPPAARGVLFMNPRSGGGKAEHADLAEECRRRGIEPVVLEPGEDWPQRVREVAASGADVLGMAGGDGSQAMVATIAAEMGLPMVVVPAGTRNHLALDIGLDRDDVVGALDAYGSAVERGMDLAEVNGRVFVNNVSLGLYAAIVRSPEYRDNKVDTTLSTLPQVIGPGTEPFDLRFRGLDGADHEGAHLIQISNNPYGETRGFGSRPQLDTKLLGIITLVLGDAGSAAAFLAALATGHPERFPGYATWSTPTFDVTSDGPIDVGLDGESQVLDPPLHFRVRPDQVRIRLPRSAPGFSPAARSLGWRQTLRELWGVVLGRPSRFQG
jgi:diacylglycerol kinase family enzyme